MLKTRRSAISKFLLTLLPMVVWSWIQGWLKTVKVTQPNWSTKTWRKLKLKFRLMLNILHRTGKVSKNWFLNLTSKTKSWFSALLQCTKILLKEKAKSRTSLLYTKNWLTLFFLNCVVLVWLWTMKSSVSLTKKSLSWLLLILLNWT